MWRFDEMKQGRQKTRPFRRSAATRAFESIDLELHGT